MHCISLLSDFGSNSSSISKIKGVLLQQTPTAQLIDVSHHVSTNNVSEAAYLTLSNYKFYPQNSIHLILIGLFQGKPPAIILHQADGHFFISAENEIIPSLFEKEAIKSYKIATIEKGIFISDWIKTIIPICLAIQSNTLDTSSYPILDQLSNDLRSKVLLKVELGGHASEEGTPDYNLQLSKDRANAVKTYLVNSGVAASKIVTKGFGETRPVASNATEEGRQLNRRVEIVR